MKIKGKVLSIILTVALLLTLFAVPVSADEMTAAEKLETLGILVGGGSGVTPQYLAGSATKITSAILLLKLKGMISNAETWSGTTNFADSNLALSLYTKRVMAYLKVNPGFGFQGYLNKLDPNAIITAQMYYKVLLTALGYEQDVDFSWTGTIAYAASKGMDEIASVTALTINDFAIATVEALDVEVKGTGMTLIEKLIDDGYISVSDATAAGWVFTPAIQSSTQIAKNKIDVTFTSSVNTSSAVIKLKQGALVYPITVAWDTAKKIATLTSLISTLPAGAYTVEVTGIDGTMTSDVTVVAPVATSVVITTDKLYANSTEIAYSVYDQFGEVAAIVTPAFGTAYNNTDAASIALTPSLTKFTFAAQTKDDVVSFTVIYNTISTTKSYAVLEESTASYMSFSAVAPLPGDLKIYENKSGYTLPYTLADQYMTPILLAAHFANADMVPDSETISGIYFISSNAAIVDPDTFVVDTNGVLKFDTGLTSGTVTITAIKNASVIASTNVTVNGTAAPAIATVTPPSFLIAAGDTASLNLVIADQYGAALDNSNVESLLTLSNNKGTVDINNTTDMLDLTFTSSGTATITIKLTSTMATLGTINLTIQPQAVASSITGVVTPKIFEVGSHDELLRGDVTVLDQYGRAFTSGTIVLNEITDTSNAITVAANTITADAVNTGTATVRVTIGSATYDYDVSIVASAAVVSYLMEPLGTIHTGGSAYYATPVLIGKDAGNNTVVLAGNGYDLLTSSNLTVADIDSLKVRGLTAGTSTITAYMGGVSRASATIIVSTEPLVAATVTIAATGVTGADVSTVVSVKDQFGVVIAAPVGTYYIDGVLKISTDNLPSGVHTVKFIASNGVLGTGSVSVTP